MNPKEMFSVCNATWRNGSTVMEAGIEDSRCCQKSCVSLCASGIMWKKAPRATRVRIGGCQKGGFPKGWFWRMFPQNENRNKGTFACSPRTKTGTWNDGTFACSPGTKTGTREHSPKPPFYETALLSPSDTRGNALETVLFSSVSFWCKEGFLSIEHISYFNTPRQSRTSQQNLRDIPKLMFDFSAGFP